MGWREALAATMADEQNDNGDGTRSDMYFVPNPLHVAWVEKSMRRLSEPDRIALARELLAGTGREATHDDAPCQMTGEQADAWASGYNAARAAMLGDEG